MGFGPEMHIYQDHYGNFHQGRVSKIDDPGGNMVQSVDTLCRPPHVLFVNQSGISPRRLVYD